MILVKEFVNRKTDNFSNIFYNSLPTVCPDCGASMEMSETLTKLSCSNLRCVSKVVQRMDAMLKSLGVKNFGEARITNFVNAWGIDNPLAIFAFESLQPDTPFFDGISLEVTQGILEQINAKKSMTLAEYVRLANLPFVQNSSSLIFGDYDDINEAYNDIIDGGAAFIQSKLGISEISTRVLLVQDSLLKFKDDLIEAIDYVDIVPVHKDEDSIFLRAVVSDEVGSGFKTKAEFYDVCNNISDKVHIEFLSSVNKNINFLIWAGAKGGDARYTNKVQKVQKYNMAYTAHKDQGKLKEGEHWITITTALDFIKTIKKMAGVE